MLTITPGLYLTIAQFDGDRAPRPLPLASGFSNEYAYLALGGFNMSESAEMFFMLSNDEGQVWFISNRHLRVCVVRPELREFRMKREMFQISTFKTEGEI